VVRQLSRDRGGQGQGLFAERAKTVFSSEPRQTGEDKNDNPAFRAAIAEVPGHQWTRLIATASMPSKEPCNDLDVISTYHADS
jgi:hypothetical protein